jgi:CDP-diacylglycerol--glycerol-3-phosphate 3-phosphatidyltransferase
MASVYDLKPKFQALLHPLCARLAARGVTANQITISAALLSLAQGCVLALTRGVAWALYLLPLVLFLRMAMNALDGMLAREFHQKSKRGAVLNELGDVVSDTALYLPFGLIPGVSAPLVGLVVALAVMTEMAGVVAVQIGAQRRYDGPFGKSDRAVFFGAFALALAAGLPVSAWTSVVLILAAGASVLTLFNRARHALEDSKAAP